MTVNLKLINFIHFIFYFFQIPDVLSEAANLSISHIEDFIEDDHNPINSDTMLTQDISIPPKCLTSIPKFHTNGAHKLSNMETDISSGHTFSKLHDNHMLGCDTLQSYNLRDTSDNLKLTESNNSKELLNNNDNNTFNTDNKFSILNNSNNNDTNDNNNNNNSELNCNNDSKYTNNSDDSNLKIDDKINNRNNNNNNSAISNKIIVDDNSNDTMSDYNLFAS